MRSVTTDEIAGDQVGRTRECGGRQAHWFLMLFLSKPAESCLISVDTVIKEDSS
jgi:hypothetical protein